MHSTTRARPPHRVTCPPPPPCVPSSPLSGRPAPMAGQPAAPQLAISVLAAPPRHTKSRKKRCPPPPHHHHQNSYIRRLRRKCEHPFSYILSAVGGLCALAGTSGEVGCSGCRDYGRSMVSVLRLSAKSMAPRVAFLASWPPSVASAPRTAYGVSLRDRVSQSSLLRWVRWYWAINAGKSCSGSSVADCSFG
jgi:hypothetical protein